MSFSLATLKFGKFWKFGQPTTTDNPDVEKQYKVTFELADKSRRHKQVKERLYTSLERAHTQIQFYYVGCDSIEIPSKELKNEWRTKARYVEAVYYRIISIEEITT